jgi:hypothetical protein
MKERRNNQRWNLLLFLPVFDTESNEVLGYIADINENGVLIFSKSHIELGKKILLEIRRQDLKEAFLDKEITEECIQFQVQSRWIDFDVKPVFHRTGFMFIDLSPAILDTIHTLIRNAVDNLA